MFLPVGCSFVFQYSLRFVHDQGQRTKRDTVENIETGQGRSINYSAISTLFETKIY